MLLFITFFFWNYTAEVSSDECDEECIDQLEPGLPVTSVPKTQGIVQLYTVYLRVFVV